MSDHNDIKGGILSIVQFYWFRSTRYRGSFYFFLEQPPPQLHPPLQEQPVEGQPMHFLPFFFSLTT